MVKKVSFITVHGMGSTTSDYSDSIIEDLKERLGVQANHVHFGSVFYQKILQENEELVWGKVAKRLKWDALRKFLLFGFADAAGLEHRKEALDSVYTKAQIIIARELLIARNAMGGDGPVIILAHSLGGQVISCYFWDAGVTAHGKKPNVGVWQDISVLEKEINNGGGFSIEETQFLRGKSLQVLNTTGCNIPIFVAAHLTSDIVPMSPPSDGFEWHNYYDKDDVLGWPLADLSAAYKRVVTDHVVNAGGGVFGWLLKSWNPLSHGEYWGDDEILAPIEKQLRKFINK